MERHANYALVGILTTLLVFGGLIFAVWLGDFQFAAKHDFYRIVFKGPVRGLGEGGEVQFNGIKVGEIEHVTLAPQDATLVQADIKVKKGTPVRADSLASTEMQGISGVNVVQIEAGTSGRPLLKSVDASDRPIIRSKANSLASLLQGGGQVMAGANEAIGRVNRLLSDRNIAGLSAAIRDVDSVTGDLAANRAMIDRAASAIAKLDHAASDIQAAAAAGRTMTNGDGRRAIADVASAASDLKVAVGEARGVIHNLDGPSRTFGSTTLPAIAATMLSVQQTADTLDGLLRQLRQDPRSVIARPRGKELELPQ